VSTVRQPWTAPYWVFLCDILGACAVAFVVGAWFGAALGPALPVLLVGGIVAHGWAMRTIDSLNRPRDQRQPRAKT
jgi:hypothetical protein